MDSKNHRIQIYSPEGEYINSFGTYGDGYGELNLPWGIHVDEFGDVYVADWGNNRVKIFSESNFDALLTVD